MKTINGGVIHHLQLDNCCGGRLSRRVSGFEGVVVCFSQCRGSGCVGYGFSFGLDRRRFFGFRFRKDPVRGHSYRLRGCEIGTTNDQLATAWVYSEHSA